MGFKDQLNLHSFFGPQIVQIYQHIKMYIGHPGLDGIFNDTHQNEMIFENHHILSTSG